MTTGCEKTPPEAPQAEEQAGPKLSDEVMPAMSVVGEPSSAPPPATPSFPGAPTVAGAAQPQEKAGSFDSSAVATKEEAEEWINQLNFMVSEYRGTYDKMPPDLEEFIRKGYFKNLPPAPAGKKYFLDPQSKQVVLQDK
ncbi:MAG TPA: hypothetical protein VGH19_08470 [Verrucomicrobiae bacterium]